MLKRTEATDPNSCWNKVEDYERVFVLRARDPAAPAAIRAWASHRIGLGKNQPGDAKIESALRCAEAMELERPILLGRPAAPLPGIPGQPVATDGDVDIFEEACQDEPVYFGPDTRPIAARILNAVFGARRENPAAALAAEKPEPAEPLPVGLPLVTDGDYDEFAKAKGWSHVESVDRAPDLAGIEAVLKRRADLMRAARPDLFDPAGRLLPPKPSGPNPLAEPTPPPPAADYMVYQPDRIEFRSKGDGQHDPVVATVSAEAFLAAIGRATGATAEMGGIGDA